MDLRELSITELKQLAANVPLNGPFEPDERMLNQIVQAAYEHGLMEAASIAACYGEEYDGDTSIVAKVAGSIACLIAKEAGVELAVESLEMIETINTAELAEKLDAETTKRIQGIDGLIMVRPATEEDKPN